MSSSSSSAGDMGAAAAVRAADNEEEINQFLVKLKSVGCEPYCFKEELRMDATAFAFPGGRTFFEANYKYFDRVKELGHPFIKAMDLGTVKHLSHFDLEKITNFFDQDNNFICKTRHGNLFRGKFEDQDVFVKIWEFSFANMDSCYYHLDRIYDELIFLRNPEIKSHSSVVNLIGYHCDQGLAVVYEGTRHDQLLSEALLSDAFGWKDRMKVAVDIGSMLKTFHDNGYVHGGVQSNCIMLDKEFCSKTFDFRLFCYDEVYEQLYQPYKHMDTHMLSGKQLEGQDWSMSDDVFMYGFLLVQLLTKVNPSYLVLRTWMVDWLYKHPKNILHESLAIDDETDCKITKLVFDCLEGKLNLEEKKEKVDIGMVVEGLKTIIVSTEPAAKRQKLCE